MKFRGLFLALVLTSICLAVTVAAQTVSTGSIQGTITDPQGAVVPGAKVTITDQATGQRITVTSSGAGTYTSGALIPGNYLVRVEQAGFRTVELPVVVQVGVTAPGSIRLSIGQRGEVVTVEASEVRVNTEQAAVQGVLTGQQIDNLPLGGRNFLDLAQLEPGVQIQDGGNFDPTKNGFSSVSFGGRFGRTARIEVDGVDISDETVGTTTQNVPAGAIQEFQLSQSSLDLSTELTSSGSVNVVTRSGSNSFHGEGFYLFRDAATAAHLPGQTTSKFQRNHFGGRLGGPIIRQKLFFFADAEHIKQELIAPVVPRGNFASLSGGFNSPFRESQVVGRLDWQIKPSNYRLFYRFSYEQNRNVSGFIPNVFQPFVNRDNTPVHALGLDFSTGSFNHALRLGYTKFRNGIVDAVTGTPIFNPAPQLELAIGSDPFCLTAGLDDFCSGPNFLAPQQTYQQNRQVKYDGSKPLGSHILRYGVGYNHILGGGFAKFLGLAPAVNSSPDISAVVGNIPGGASNPLNYQVQTVFLGNGQGFSSEKPSFTFPGGRLGPDNRFFAYIGDSWKVKPNFTLAYGLRYVRDTGRTDSDLGPIPCSQLDPALAAALTAGGTPCTTSVLDLWGKGLGNRVRQPNQNFAPQLGFTWDPSSSGKMVIRAGIGLFYENSIWNNNLFNRPARLQKGLFLVFAPACLGGSPVPVKLPAGPTVTPAFCGQAIGNAAPAIAALQQQYQAATVAAGAAVNSGFIGNTLASGNTNGTNMFAPNYITPRSVQMNIGVQRQLWKSSVLTVDYVRNVATHNLLAVDANHVGDARFLNKANALAAISATNAAFGCGAGADAASINCAIAAGARIGDFAANGLDSGNVFCGGAPCPTTAFPGINPNLGQNEMLFPVGRSVYNGLLASWKQNVDHPFPVARHMSFQASYSFSRYLATARDTDFISNAEDFNHPVAQIGPNGLDRKHQVSFGGTVDLPLAFRVSVISHFYSPLPLSLRLPTVPAGGIFVTDVNGDGSGDGSFGLTGHLVPGTTIGSFGRDVSAGSSLANFIGIYNISQAGTLTPAGQALVNAGLFTKAQLGLLRAVKPMLQPPPAGQQGLDWLRAFDLKLGWEYKIKERLTIEPSIFVYNLFNFANFDGPGGTLNGVLNAFGNTTAGAVNSTTYSDQTPQRLGLGSGVFALGAPRAIEFGLRLSF